MPSASGERSTFRRALAVSVAIHLALAAIGIVFLRVSSVPPRPAAGIDTGADVVIRSFDAGRELDLPPSLPPAPEPPEAPVNPPEPVSAPAGGLVPRADRLARPLPAEMMAIISRTVAAQPTAAGAPAPAAGAIHGMLAPGKSIVYVLDISGSMGEYGKLARAREALLATLRAQPESVRFQVIVYGGAARPLLVGAGCLPATSANIEAAAAALGTQAASGRSNHVEAIRRAVACRPDVILFLTDAADLPAAALQPLLAERRQVALSVARVTPTSIEKPRLLH